MATCSRHPEELFQGPLISMAADPTDPWLWNNSLPRWAYLYKILRGLGPPPASAISPTAAHPQVLALLGCPACRPSSPARRDCWGPSSAVDSLWSGAVQMISSRRRRWIAFHRESLPV